MYPKEWLKSPNLGCCKAAAQGMSGALPAEVGLEGRVLPQFLPRQLQSLPQLLHNLNMNQNILWGIFHNANP